MVEIASPGYIETFKNKARSWARDVVELNNTHVTGDMANDKESLLKFAKYIKGAAEKILGTIDELDNIGLGVIPIIPIAVVAGVLGSMYKWTLDYSKFKKKLAEQKRLENKGVDPLTASKIVSGGADSLTNYVKSVGTALVLGGALFYLVRGRK